MLLGAALFTVCTRARLGGTPSLSLPAIATADEFSAAASQVGDRMVVLYIQSAQCGGCRELDTTISQLRNEYRDRADFYLVDAERAKIFVRTIEVQGIPAVVFVKKERKISAFVGIHEKSVYVKIFTLCEESTSIDGCMKKVDEFNKR
jgi:thiol-disulfide isomerase/thioredoxin